MKFAIDFLLRDDCFFRSKMLTATVDSNLNLIEVENGENFRIREKSPKIFPKQAVFPRKFPFLSIPASHQL